MRRQFIYMLPFVFLVTGLSIARADQTRVAVNDTHAPVAGISPLSDEALASYISGRLKQALRNDDETVTQYCDTTGCSVVVQ